MEPAAAPISKRGSISDRFISVETHAHLMPGEIFDANGQEVRWCRKANLDTGECEVVAHDEQGNLITLANGYLVIEHIRRPAPLLFVSKRI